MANNIPSRTSNTRENGNTQPSVIDTPSHPTCQGVEKASLEFVIVVVNGSDDQLSDVINRSNMSAKKKETTEGKERGGWWRGEKYLWLSWKQQMYLRRCHINAER